ncbi:MAG: metallophosphoesterase family protein [Eubacteriales bacterium]
MAVFPVSSFADELLKTDKTTYSEGEDIMITAVGDGDDWVGIYQKGDTLKDVVSIRWYYVAKEGNTSGTAKNIFDSEYVNRSALADLPAGEYTVYLLADGGYTVLSRVDITVTADSGENPPETSDEKTLTTDKTCYLEGEPILTTATGEGYDWVGLYLRTDTLKTDQAIRWYYVARDGNRSGSEKNIRTAEGTNASRAAYADVPAGEYTVYLCANDKWDVLASVDITVYEDPAAQTVPEAPSNVTYERTGSFVGAADGKLTVTAGEGGLPDSYAVYWGNSDGKLENYTAFAPVFCTGQVTAYEMVANTLIPTEADRILVYSVKGKNISQTAATVMLPDGCNDYDFGALLYEMQVVSDIHLNASQSHLHNVHFAAVLADIQMLSPNSIGLFINGDIADHGQVSEYRAFRQLIENAGDSLPEVYCAIGNHDLAQGPYATQLANFTEYSEPCTDQPYADLWLNGVHFIFLGSEAEGLNAQLSRTQLNWLKKALAENRNENRPIYVFLHQGLMDTVAGTFEYQGWHGVNQARQLAAILKDYPEVVLFSGHSHWEMDSLYSMKARDENLPTVFNTAATAYLWNDVAMSTNVGVEGSQGYYIKAYSDKLLVLGRDFVNGQWIASAQFVVQLPQSQEGSDPGESEKPAVTSDSDITTAPPTNSAPVGEETPNTADRNHSFPIGLLIGAAVAAAVIGIAVAMTVKKKRK